MEKTVKHRFLNNALFTALIVPLAFFVLRDTIAVLTGLMFESMGGEESLLYQINDDIARLIIAGLLMLIMPIFFRGRCNFGFKGGFLKLGILLSLPAAKSMSSRTTLKENGGFWLNVIELTVKRLCVSNSKVTECRLPPEVMPKMLSPPGMKRFLPTKTRFMLDASSVL